MRISPVLQSARSVLPCMILLISGAISYGEVVCKESLRGLFACYYVQMKNNTLESVETKEIRAKMQEIVDILMDKGATRSCSIAVTKLQESKMWLGQHLGELPDNEDLNKARDAQELA